MDNHIENEPAAAITNNTVTVTDNLGNVTFIHTDGLGNPVARTDGAGKVISTTRYEPYGYVAGGATPTVGFTGHVNDADTGLTYMQQRYYDPVAGRFLSIDPVTTDANTRHSFNRYAYAVNNPYTYIDPDGREEEKKEPDKRDRQIEEQLRKERERTNPGGWSVSSPSGTGGDDKPWGSYLPGTEAGANAAQYWANMQVETGNPLYAVPGVLASLWTPDTAIATGTTLLAGGAASWGVRLGRELSIGSNFRLAPFGNRTGNRLGELPHYHRRGIDPVTGATKPGQGIGRHRPYEKKSTDKSIWDRF